MLRWGSRPFLAGRPICFSVEYLSSGPDYHTRPPAPLSLHRSYDTPDVRQPMRSRTSHYMGFGRYAVRPDIWWRAHLLQTRQVCWLAHQRIGRPPETSRCWPPPNDLLLLASWPERLQPDVENSMSCWKPNLWNSPAILGGTQLCELCWWA